MKYQLTFITAQALAEFIVEFMNNTLMMNFEVEETNRNEFIVTILRP